MLDITKMLHQIIDLELKIDDEKDDWARNKKANDFC